MPADEKFEMYDSNSELHELDFDNLWRKPRKLLTESSVLAESGNRRNEAQSRYCIAPAWRAGGSQKKALEQKMMFVQRIAK